MTVKLLEVCYNILSHWVCIKCFLFRQTLHQLILSRSKGYLKRRLDWTFHYIPVNWPFNRLLTLSPIFVWILSEIFYQLSQYWLENFDTLLHSFYYVICQAFFFLFTHQIIIEVLLSENLHRFQDFESA